MKVLVIPDVHLKPWMFRRASELLKDKNAGRAVCLMDIADDFVRRYVSSKHYNDVDEVLSKINNFGCGEMWQDLSPIWYRPQYYAGKMYKPRKLLQVVGHTPVEQISRKGNLISCDVFSTDRDGKPVGTQEFPVIDAVTWEYHGVR